MKKQELVGYGVLGVGALWLLSRFGSGLGVTGAVLKEKVENLWEEVAPGSTTPSVIQGPLEHTWETRLGDWIHGWYDSFKIHVDNDGPEGGKGFLEFESTVMHFAGEDDNEKNVTALQGDPIALYYFGRAVADISNFGQLVLTRQPYREEVFQADCFRYGYGFEFLNVAQGQRVVRRLYERCAVDWIYNLAGHHKEPGEEMRSWLTAGGRRYLVMVDRNPKWVDY